MNTDMTDKNGENLEDQRVSQPSGAFPFAPRVSKAVPKAEPQSTQPVDAQRAEAKPEPTPEPPKSKGPPVLVNPVTGEAIVPQGLRQSSTHVQPPTSDSQYDQQNTSGFTRRPLSELHGNSSQQTPPPPSQGLYEHPGISSASASSQRPNFPNGEPLASLEDYYAAREDSFDANLQTGPGSVITMGSTMAALAMGFFVCVLLSMGTGFTHQFGMYAGGISRIGFGWFAGYLIGYVSSYLGGRGKGNGFVCALVAGIAVLGGNLLYPVMVIKTTGLDSPSTQEYYNRTIHQANAWDQVTSHEETQNFMMRYGYTMPGRLKAWTEEETSDFRATQGLELERFGNLNPTYSDFIRNQKALRTDYIKEILKMIIIFSLAGILLAIGMAYHTGGARDGEL